MNLRLGIDVGSTTVKLAIYDSDAARILYSGYRRHNAKQAQACRELLEATAESFGAERFRIAACGSGGRPIAEALGARYVQEVVSNAAAVRALYPQARTAIELGGQDAKIVFFCFDPVTSRLSASDMRMNGSCAGGTGAFIDEVAALLGVPTEEFEALAAKGRIVHEISGRCGVFAKTDIQPLLIQGAAREDVALSTLHALAKQTIGGLSQGLELSPPIIFEGGPLTFNPTLIRVFAQRLNLKESDIIRPDHSETLVACGAAIALDELFPIEDEGPECRTLLEAARMLREDRRAVGLAPARADKPFFASREDEDAFARRHESQALKRASVRPGGALRAYIGIDSGSTTSKLALIDERENVLDLFYSNNNGDPLRVVRDGLSAIAESYRERGVELEVLGLGTTGYGEQLFARAFGADYHTVETVAHAEGCRKFYPDASFILDIGGQDMKAIWLRDGVVTNLTLNEACSSGCGSFLENFAASLGIPVDHIAEAAFRSRSPAALGSRCTVFMNSTIINEQKNGRQADDLMAGLCRSIVENVFTKVVRISSAEELGERIVVQGGTFNNLAVLRALEEYLGKEVVRAPYPGEMGALGVALATKRHLEAAGGPGRAGSSFIGLDAVTSLSFAKEEGLRCPLCANHCSRAVMTFSTGARWVTGNRCERGAIVADTKEELARRLGEAERARRAVPDMFRRREELLFADYAGAPAAAKRGATIGLPRSLEFWDSMPFWTTFFRALGYETRLSAPSSHELFESGLQYVASDTICFPAKLAHGHILDLAKKGVDRIFMPFVMHMPPEGLDRLSPYVCPIIMGYPMVVRNFESPESRYGIPFDTPVFHWFTKRDRRLQICEYAMRELGASKDEATLAFDQAETAIEAFRARLKDEGRKIIDGARERGGFAIVLAGRPYHNDPLVHHNIDSMFAKAGIPVLAVDSLPGVDDVSLRHTRAEVTNVFHTRMLTAALVAAATPELEYAQIVSFGCGHDAVLSDEIVRIMTEVGGKPPLILKVDESESAGSLGIRVQSFIETVRVRRGAGRPGMARVLPDPYTTKFLKHEKRLKTVIIPNISAPASKILSAVIERSGFRARTVPIGSVDQIRLGKKYAHNDICFPCQMVIGEALSELMRGGYGHGEAAVAMVKFQCDCRMSQYAGLLRKALDSSGFGDVAILATDFNNTKDLNPGLSIFSPASLIEAVWGCMMMDILDGIRRAIRPYELIAGETNRIFEECIDRIADAMGGGLPKAVQAYRASIDAFCGIGYDRSDPKPRVFVAGEILVTFHPGTNFHVEDYLVANGMEPVFPRVTDQLRKDFLATISEIRDFKAKLPKANYLADRLFDLAQASMEKIAQKHPLFRSAARPRELYEEVRDIIPETLSCGEGWLIAAEIAHHAADGVTSFIVLQPFGCLPNHVCGRGVTKRIKDKYPTIQILPVDLDPDTSFANVENRLQMLIMNEKSHRSPESTWSRRRPA